MSEAEVRTYFGITLVIVQEGLVRIIPLVIVQEGLVRIITATWQMSEAELDLDTMLLNEFSNALNVTKKQTDKKSKNKLYLDAMFLHEFSDALNMTKKKRQNQFLP
jgi:hypothetical protein